MKDSRHVNKVEYYNKLLSNSEKNEIIIETIADKIAKSMGMQLIDFSKNKTKVIYINRVRNEKDILMLNKPIKIYIKKFIGGFSVSQKNISLVIFAPNFREALTKFQKTFFDDYQKYLLLDPINGEDVAFKKFYSSLMIASKD